MPALGTRAGEVKAAETQQHVLYIYTQHPLTVFLALEVYSLEGPTFLPFGFGLSSDVVS